MSPFFIYLYPKTGEVIAYTYRNDLSTGVLLFTCPENWLPQNQKEFEAAAKFYLVRDPERMTFRGEDIPF